MGKKRDDKALRIKAELEGVLNLNIGKGIPSLVTLSVGRHLVNLKSLERVFAAETLSLHPTPEMRPRKSFSLDRVHFGGERKEHLKRGYAHYLDFWIQGIENEKPYSMSVYVALLAYCEIKAKKRL